jgi:hypothetical protein
MLFILKKSHNMKFNLLLRSFAFGLLLLAIGFASCKKNQNEEISYFTAAELADIRANTCLTQDADEPYAMTEAPEDGAQDRATGAKNKFWSPGQVLRVRFMNGSTTLQNKVFAYAQQWESYANIDFVKVTSGTAEIRVAFDADGHYSYLGKDNLNIPSNQKTMNLEFNSNTPENQIRGTTLHEFGHALGLNHEHQHPMANIPWNTQAVYAFYQTLGWSKAKTDANVLNKISWESSQHTIYDVASIMEYPVQANLTTNGFSVGNNTLLSATDKDFIGKMYSSQRIRVRHNVNTTGNLTFWLNGIYHTLKPNESLWVPAKTSGNQLSIWECPNGNCVWDGYQPAYGYNYKIVAQGGNGNLTLAYD